MSALAEDFDAALVDAQTTLHRAARKLCFSRSNPEEAADDILQDTNIRALAVRDQFCGGSLVGWVYAILRNVFRDHVRRLKVRELEITFSDLATHDEDGNLVEPEYADHGDPHTKLEAIQTLNQIDAMPLLSATALLCAGLGMTCSEISRQLATSEANVRQLVARGRTALRNGEKR